VELRGRWNEKTIKEAKEKASKKERLVRPIYSGRVALGQRRLIGTMLLVH